ncbi:MAG: Flp family type IVb pilin [Actinobacteria bacterium]|nr:Flp family type IVb pilin [Actinomycetota bacterium]
MLSLLAKNFRSMWEDESGQGMVEYGLIIAVVAIVLIVALTNFKTELQNLFGRITTGVQTAPTQ